MSQTYRAMVVGMGKRGKHHAAAFHANPRFEVVGICDIDTARLEAAAADLGNPKIETDAAALARDVKPDIFCFCTLPALRAEMIRAGIDGGARLIAFEKPVALTSAEGFTVKRMLDEAGVKAVVSHQHRYGKHYQAVKQIIASGALGRIQSAYATATGWTMHMVTHMIDYMRWYLGEPEAEWVMAQAAGRGKLTDNHPSADYLAGVIQFAGGVHGWLEVGGGAPDQPEVAKWWGKNRIGVQGTEGFAEVLTNGGWRAVTKDGVQSGDGAMNYDLDMPPYVQEMADWLDDDAKVHSCAFEQAWKGFEISMALYRSVIEGGQRALPLDDGMDELAALKEKLPDKKVLLGFPGSAAEYA